MKTETLTCEIRTSYDGISIVKYYNSKGDFHNPIGPAYVVFYKNGDVKRKSFWINGKLLSEKGFNNLQNAKDFYNGEIIEIKGKRYQLKLIE